MSEPVEFLDLDDLRELARRLLGDPPPLRDIGLLESAVARPQSTAGGEDAAPAEWTEAAALLQPVVSTRALVDGNKRIDWLAAGVFLEVNDSSVAAATNDEVFDLVWAVASSAPTIDEIARRLEQRHRPHS